MIIYKVIPNKGEIKLFADRDSAIEYSRLLAAGNFTSLAKGVSSSIITEQISDLLFNAND